MNEKGNQDAVFVALAHPARRRIIDLLVQVPGGGTSPTGPELTITTLTVYVVAVATVGRGG